MTQQRLIVSSLAGLCLWLAGSVASAQIDRPGNHINYSAEIEPHLVLQWQEDFFCDDEGLGLGLRASIPVMEDGPVPKINNSLAVGFGLDWANFSDDCRPWSNDPLYYDYSANAFWLPIVVQWNFFFSDLISAFPEFGLAIEHSVWEWDSGYCGGPGRPIDCDVDDSDTEVHPVLWLGVRFHLADSFSLTVRIGTPSLLLGASFFL